MAQTRHRPTIGIVGLGVIGRAVARAVVHDLRGLDLAGVSVRDPATGAGVLADLAIDVPVETIDRLVERCDIIFDAAIAASLPDIARRVLTAGRTLVTMNSGALLACPELFEVARTHDARIVVPSGGVAGFDGIRAANLSGCESLTLISRKPPESLAGAPHVVAHGYDLSNLAEPLCVFTGNAREAALAFPANANVAATLSLAGPGPERTMVEMWADPNITRITQLIHMVSAAAELRLEIQSTAMPENPKTGSLTPLSAIAALRALIGHVQIGS